MNKKFIHKYSQVSQITLIVSISLIIISCEVFDKEPLDSLYEEQVWDNEALANGYLNNQYFNLMPKFSANNNQGLSDETAFGTDNIGPYQNSSSGVFDIAKNKMYGTLLKDDVNDLDQTFYKNIVQLNRIFLKIDKGNLSTVVKNRIKAQARFLRAWSYWEKVKLYGGIPMILHVPEIVTDGTVPDELYVSRNKTSECIKLICNDLDTAFKYLPDNWDDDDDYGRITRGGAAALKGRVLLYWASPQFNPDNEIDRWEDAYAANQIALDTLTKDGYGLHPSFEELFNMGIENTNEAIFFRVYKSNVYDHNFDAGVRPERNGISRGGRSCNPTWQLVQAFPKLDGYPLYDTTSTTVYDDSTIFWFNRDPRLLFTIAINGSYWPLSGIDDYRVWSYTIKDETKYKNDNYDKSSITGFYCKKWVDPNILKEDCPHSGTDWIEIRFAEVILNLAECANELQGKSDEVRELLNRIRNERDDVKVPMDYIDEHLGEPEILREIIMTERQIELAFENKRHWDLRRRNMFTEDLGPNIKKLNGTIRTGWKIAKKESYEIEKLIEERHLFKLNIDNDYRSTKVNYNLYFQPGKEIILDSEGSINYKQPEYNFYPIHNDNLKKNPNLVQNYFWGGSFDPYE